MIVLAVALATLAAILVPLSAHGLFDPHPGARCKPRPQGRHVLAVPALDARPVMPLLTTVEAM